MKWTLQEWLMLYNTDASLFWSQIIMTFHLLISWTGASFQSSLVMKIYHSWRKYCYQFPGKRIWWCSETWAELGNTSYGIPAQEVMMPSTWLLISCGLEEVYPKWFLLFLSSSQVWLRRFVQLLPYCEDWIFSNCQLWTAGSTTRYAHWLEYSTVLQNEDLMPAILAIFGFCQ